MASRMRATQSRKNPQPIKVALLCATLKQAVWGTEQHQNHSTTLRCVELLPRTDKCLATHGDWQHSGSHRRQAPSSAQHSWAATTSAALPAAEGSTKTAAQSTEDPAATNPTRTRGTADTQHTAPRAAARAVAAVMTLAAS